MNKDEFFKKIKEAEQHYYKNSPCHHCHSGNGCDDCRGCKDGEIDVQMRQNVNKLKDEYKEKFGVDYNEEVRELILKTSKENHKKKLLEEVWEKCSLLEILNAGGYDYETIKNNGYRWNPQTKLLEKQPDPIFKIGQTIKLKGCPDENMFWCVSDIKNYQYIFNNGRIIDIDEQHHYELIPDKLNDENKTLEALIEAKFKVGDKIKYKDTILTIIDVRTNNYIVEDEPDNFGILMFSQQDMWELVSDIKPNFKVGDRIRCKANPIFVFTITNITKDKYECGKTFVLRFTNQDEYELVPNKFNINTLKPFDKVLVRDTEEQVWVADLFSHTVNRPLGGYTFACVGHYPNQCIPYKDNEHLLGTNNEPDSFYKIWEKIK